MSADSFVIDARVDANDPDDVDEDTGFTSFTDTPNLHHRLEKEDEEQEIDPRWAALKNLKNNN